MNIAEEAQKLVLGDRNDSYGNPREDFVRVAKVWSGILADKLKVDITPEEAIMMMVGLKLCREIHKPKADNRIDGIGYLLCLDWATTGVRPDGATKHSTFVPYPDGKTAAEILSVGNPVNSQ